MPATVQNNNAPAQVSAATNITPNTVSAYGNSLSPAISTPPSFGAPTLDFGPASTLMAGPNNVGGFMPPSVFDANSMNNGGFMLPSVFDMNNAGSMFGTAGMPTSFLNAQPTALDIALANSINAAFSGAIMSPPMGQQPTLMQQPGTVNPGANIAEYGRMMSQVAGATQQPGMVNPNNVGPVSVAEYGRVMSQIAGYQQATAQLGMDTALYSAQMAGQTAGIQAMGQQAMMYMNAIA